MSKNKKRGVSWAEAYETPSRQGSLGGVEPFARAQSVSIGRARQALQPLLSYTLHKPRRRRFPTLPVVVLGMDEQWVADLVEMQALKKWNRGVRYLLTVVDVLSKYAWVEPLKDKTGKAVAAAFERILKRARGRQPLRLQTDAATALPVLSFRGSTQAYFDNTSTTVNRYRTPRFHFFRACISTRSATHCSSMPSTTTGRVGNRRRRGLCKV